jgi:hypothetical protein
MIWLLWIRLGKSLTTWRYGFLLLQEGRTFITNTVIELGTLAKAHNDSHHSGCNDIWKLCSWSKYLFKKCTWSISTNFIGETNLMFLALSSMCAERWSDLHTFCTLYQVSDKGITCSLSDSNFQCTVASSETRLNYSLHKINILNVLWKTNFTEPKKVYFDDKSQE